MAMYEICSKTQTALSAREKRKVNFIGTKIRRIGNKIEELKFIKKTLSSHFFSTKELEKIMRFIDGQIVGFLNKQSYLLESLKSDEPYCRKNYDRLVKKYRKEWSHLDGQ